MDDYNDDDPALELPELDDERAPDFKITRIRVDGCSGDEHHVDELDDRRARHRTASPRRNTRPHGVDGRRSRRAADRTDVRHRSRWRALARCNDQAAADWRRLKDTPHGADGWS